MQTYQCTDIFRAVILFLVYSVERNIYDQRWLEYAIVELDSRITVVRCSLKEITARGRIADDRRLFVYVRLFVWIKFVNLLLHFADDTILGK